MTQYSKIIKSSSKSLKNSLFKRISFLGFFAVLILATIQCASIKQPTGGPKDSIAPEVLEVMPANYSKNFTAKKIEITFNEFIKISNQNKEFSITPDIETAPKYRVRKKTLEIILPDSLEKNTTYTINFGKGLVDYNAANPLINYYYVFATGSELDSLSISGKVIDKATQEPQKDIKVLLIPTSQDSIFGKKKANIFTLTDSAGNYKINNLRENNYRIYALKEENNDRIYNGQNEYIGFRKDSIHLVSNLTGINLEIFKGIPEKLRITDKKVEENGRVLVTFNKPLKNAGINILNDEKNNSAKIFQMNATKDSAFLFIPNLNVDSLALQIIQDNTPVDTTIIRKISKKINREIIPVFNTQSKVDRIRHLTITSVTPIKNIDKNKIVFTEDSTKRTNFQLMKDSIHTNLFYLRYNWRKDKKYEIVFKDSAMTGYFNEKNKEAKLNLVYDDTENYGDLKYTFTDLDSTAQYLVQLINEKKDHVYRTDIVNISENKVDYKQFPGGKYTLRVILDVNKNGEWDTGDVYKKIFPEPVIYLNKTFTIRANWEQNDTFSLAPLKKP